MKIILPNRKCSSCGKIKSLEQFPRAKGTNDKIYYRRTCKTCRHRYETEWKKQNIEHVKAWRKNHYEENRENIKARVADWQKKNRERKLEYQREWYQQNREERITRQRQWYQENKDIVEAYREANKERVSERMRQWRISNVDIIRQYQEEWRKENAMKILDYSRKYRTKYPHIKRLSETRRRARKRSAEGIFTWDDVENLFVLQVSQCVYCEADLGTDFHIDHITPLSRGGDNTAENIQLLCRACNLKKHAKTHDEFLAILQKAK